MEKNGMPKSKAYQVLIGSSKVCCVRKQTKFEILRENTDSEDVLINK
jgi:hypothetical protein